MVIKLNFLEMIQKKIQMLLIQMMMSLSNQPFSWLMTPKIYSEMLQIKQKIMSGQSKSESDFLKIIFNVQKSDFIKI